MQSSKEVIKRVQTGAFKPKHFSAPKIDRLNESNLPQFLYWYKEDMLQQRGNQFYCAVRGTEYVLYDNRAYDYYTGQTYLPLAFLQQCLDYTFPEALYLLNYFYRKVDKADVQAELDTLLVSSHGPIRPAPTAANLDSIKDENQFMGLDADKAYTRTYAYLHDTRFISRAAIGNFISQKFLMMDSRNNLCFLTYRDPCAKDEVIAITKKGTTRTPFKQNYTKEPHTGFFFATKDNLLSADYEEIFIFEAVIDLMAYLSLLWDGRITEGPQHKEKRCYIALNGAGNWEYITKVLHQYPSIQTVSLCLDNDTAGIEGAHRIRGSALAPIPDEQVYDLQETGLRVLSAKYDYRKDWGEAVKIPLFDLGITV